MRVSCPACDAAYEVPEGLLVPARRLRCAQCGAEWQPRLKSSESVDIAAPGWEPEPGPPQLPLPAQPAAKVVQPVPRPAAAPKADEPAAATLGELRERVAAAKEPAPPPRGRSAALLAAAWVASAVILLGCFYGAYIYRGQVMLAWPPSQRAYAAIGLGPT